MSHNNNDNIIESKAEYHKAFGLTRDIIQETNNKRQEKQQKILESALDIRKFEIQLYWERTKYFTSLITGSFGGYALFASKILDIDCKVRAPLLLLLTFLGFILSLAWYLSNRGSKYWQENWERHVDALEDEIIGSLYKTTLNFENQNIYNPLQAYPFSVSKINQILSFIITLIWSLLFIIAFQNIQLSLEFKLQEIFLYIDNLFCKIIFPSLFLLFFSMKFMCFTKGKSQNPSTRKIDFKSVKQSDKKQS